MATNILSERPQTNHVYIIAEAGINHNGNIETAKQMIDAAAQSGCDSIKFQHYFLDEVSELKDKPELYNAVKLAQFNIYDFAELRDYCYRREIDFLCSAFGKYSAGELAELELPILKIPSGKLTDLELLRFVCNKFPSFICSTGLTTIQEIELALLELKQGTELKNIALLHCVSAYPCPLEQINLRAMNELRLAGKVGVSDHTFGNVVPVVAAALGAQIIEKHFTLNRDQAGPDHSISLEPMELYTTVLAIRDVEKVLGDGVKKIEKAETEWIHRKK